MATVALVTTTEDILNGEDVDSDQTVAVLAELGVHASRPVWHDPAVDWASFDLLVLRSPWDYPERLDEFRSWLRAVVSTSVVCNPPDLIEWNLDKRYVRALAAAGVPAVPTQFCERVDEVRAALDAHDGEVVVKPTTSCGARDTGRFASNDPAAAALAERIVAGGRCVMVQPFVASVAEQGETALVYFDGEFSHAFSKGPFLEQGGELIGGAYTEVVAPVMATPAQVAVADQALAVARQHAGGELPLHGRFDLIAGDAGEPMVLEAELFEPSLYLDMGSGAVNRYAQAIALRARRAASQL
ncbi:MAG: ATP-grasp domain-containing protein [Acidimicrobiia bacterium]